MPLLLDPTVFHRNRELGRTEYIKHDSVDPFWVFVRIVCRPFYQLLGQVTPLGAELTPRARASANISRPAGQAVGAIGLFREA